MKRILIASWLCLLIASCASQQAAITAMPTNTSLPPATIKPLPSATSAVQLTNTPLPASIVEGAHRSGMSPEEIVSFYWEIHSYLENNNVAALADKIYFPLNECWRSKGDNIATKNEFIQRFNEVFTDEIISDYLNSNLEDTRIDMYGVYIGGIWFTSICTDNTCNITQTWIFGVNDYCSIRRTPPMEEEQSATLSALPGYSGESFVYGTYKMKSYEDHGCLITEDELKQAFNQIKTLRGIVPICASCKKIRNDKGYWQQIEAYIQAHSDAVFSHGICPDCSRKLYPDVQIDENPSESARAGHKGES